MYLKISWRGFVLIRFNANTRATNLRVYCYWSYSKQNSASTAMNENWIAMEANTKWPCSSFRLSNRECAKTTLSRYTRFSKPKLDRYGNFVVASQLQFKSRSNCGRLSSNHISSQQTCEEMRIEEWRRTRTARTPPRSCVILHLANATNCEHRTY